jgi:hypothetical protein
LFRGVVVPQEVEKSFEQTGFIGPTLVLIGAVVGLAVEVAALERLAA